MGCIRKLQTSFHRVKETQTTRQHCLSEPRQYPFHQRTTCVCTYLLTVRHASAGKLHFLFFGHPVGSYRHSGACSLLQHLALFKWETLHKRSFYIGRWYLFMFLILALLWDFLESTNTVAILSASVNASKSPVYMVIKTSGLQIDYIYSE